MLKGEHSGSPSATYASAGMDARWRTAGAPASTELAGAELA